MVYQFSLRNVPSTILNEPSIENFTQIFTLLETNKIFNSQWNIIKHSQPFLMLCKFFTSNIIAPAAKITLIINTDLTWNVIVGHRHVKGTIAIPDKLRNSGDFIYLFNLFDTCLVCSGICDSELVQLATAANRQGCFKDHHGNIKAELCNGTIRPINCSGSCSIIVTLIQLWRFQLPVTSWWLLKSIFSAFVVYRYCTCKHQWFVSDMQVLRSFSPGNAFERTSSFKNICRQNQCM